MPDADTTTYNLAAYSTDFRWTGDASVPSQRRLSDHINDERIPALVLNHAIPATWEGALLKELPKTESIALPKRNLLFVVLKSDVPLPPSSQMERIRKDPFQVIMYIPPFTLTGKLSLPRNADWLHMATSATEGFFPVTKVSIWHIKAHTRIETDVNLVMVNWKWLLGLEPKR